MSGFEDGEDYMENIERIDWEKDELVPVITQDTEGTVLTLAYMDREALELTLKTGAAHYYSRSKGRIRMKGEVSGNVQNVKEIKLDCDADALLMIVEQKGVACHTGNYSCFYRYLAGSDRERNEEKDEFGYEEMDEVKGIDYSLIILKELEELIKQRRNQPIEGSYTSRLFSAGKEEINKKLGEEAVEVIVSKEREGIVYETADMLYHLLVKLRVEDIELKEVMKELRKRRR